jgi:hypothetical protein
MKRKYSVYVHGNTVRHGGTVKNLNRNNYVKTMNADPNNMIHSHEAIRTTAVCAAASVCIHPYRHISHPHGRPSHLMACHKEYPPGGSATTTRPIKKLSF